MSTYAATVSNVAVSGTTNDLMTLTPAANRRVWVTECSIGGLGTASAASIICLNQVTTAGITGGSTITASPWDKYSPTAASVINTTWSTQPVIGVPYVTLPVNANGGLYRWVARPGQEINLIGGVTGTGMQLSVRASLAGGSNYTITLTWIEDPI